MFGCAEDLVVVPDVCSKGSEVRAVAMRVQVDLRDGDKAMRVKRRVGRG